MEEVKTSGGATNERQQYLTKRWNLPAQNKNFTGRENLLSQISERLSGSKPLVITACHGLGGVGKTQLATEFSYRNEKKYERIIWIPAASTEQIETAYLSLGQDLGIIPEKTKPAIAILMVKTWLADRPRNLVIFDGAPDHQTVETYFLPKGADILITSRNKEWAGGIEVNVFSLEEAVLYFKKIVGERVGDTKETIEELAEELGRLPLALAQATAYIRQNKISIQDYLDLYRAKRAYFLSQGGDLHVPVYVTWDITMIKIREESQTAEALFRYCVFLDHNEVPLALLDGSDDRTEDIGLLHNYSMVNRDEDRDSLSFHVLIQEVFVSKINEEPKKQNIYAEIASELSQKFDSIIGFSTGEASSTLLLKNIISALERLDGFNSQLAGVWLLYYKAVLYKGCGMADKAIDFLGNALTMLETFELPLRNSVETKVVKATIYCRFVHLSLMYYKDTREAKKYLEKVKEVLFDMSAVGQSEQGGKRILVEAIVLAEEARYELLSRGNNKTRVGVLCKAAEVKLQERKEDVNYYHVLALIEKTWMLFFLDQGMYETALRCNKRYYDALKAVHKLNRDTDVLPATTTIRYCIDKAKILNMLEDSGQKAEKSISKAVMRSAVIPKRHIEALLYRAFIRTLNKEAENAAQDINEIIGEVLKMEEISHLYFSHKIKAFIHEIRKLDPETKVKVFMLICYEFHRVKKGAEYWDTKYFKMCLEKNGMDGFAFLVRQNLWLVQKFLFAGVGASDQEATLSVTGSQSFWTTPKVIAATAAGVGIASLVIAHYMGNPD